LNIYFATLEVRNRPIAMSVYIVCLSVCLSITLAYLKDHASKLNEIFCTCFLCRGSVLLWRQCNMLCTSGFVDGMFVHSRPGKGDANRAYTQSYSPGAAPGTKSDSTIAYSLQKFLRFFTKFLH